MTIEYPFKEGIDLLVEGRISPDDASRQELTARDILHRFSHQPGVILADEVGMGKTFVALAVAVSVALADRRKRPVVVMVPSSLRDKWPKDFEVFKERCIPPGLSKKLRTGTAERSVEFLKLLDDPPERRKSVLFVTHGAMSRALFDKWTKLALVHRALKGRHGVDDLRRALSRFLPDVLQMKSIAWWPEDVWLRLLSTNPRDWLTVMKYYGVDPDGNGTPEEADDPVPISVLDALDVVDLEPLHDVLGQVPLRRGKNYEKRINAVRRKINDLLRDQLWPAVLLSLRLKLPLLILDEAHHLKNSSTRLASLFRADESQEDAEAMTKGPLGHTFERMLFLTATPFQLGHAELCSVLDRFDGIVWAGHRKPSLDRTTYREHITDLRAALDAAQLAALRLELTWGQLTKDDLIVDGTLYQQIDDWWRHINSSEKRTELATQVLDRYVETQDRMSEANTLLKPWVIRHIKSRHLKSDDVKAEKVDRRIRLIGRAIVDNKVGSDEQGIAIGGRALLPFLLAARATTSAPESRPVFAEGLASSYEAFLHTRMQREINSEHVLDSDDDATEEIRATDAQRWYLEQLDEIIGEYQAHCNMSHPKLDATVERAVKLWGNGEKVVVFCHYIATGKVLRQRISDAISDEIKRLGAVQLQISEEEVHDSISRIGDRFFDIDSPVRRAVDSELEKIIEGFSLLKGEVGHLVGVIRRYLRTPSFLVRYGLIEQGRAGEVAVERAMSTTDSSGMNLRQVITDFCDFLANRCSEDERRRYIHALEQLQTGVHYGTDVDSSFSEDELAGERSEQLIPNVRLVNGSVRHETRERLMLTFNTPFYPEVLVTSNVLAEGVDLHLNCRFMIHHDLCWNPSTLEQRTGRVDRIGAKCERSNRSVNLYLPFISETQDEKMFRVVTDRERWFNVVMGEKYETNARHAEKLADRIPFPEKAAEELAFQLESSIGGP